MNTARQILRFSIPGSIFILQAVGCYLVFRRIQGAPLAESSTLIRENIGAVIAVVATIPIGFVIYQIYYFTYEPVLRLWPLRWDGRLVRKDRGGQILKTLHPDQIATLEAIFDCSIQIEEAHCVVPGGRGPLGKLMHATGVLEIAGAAKDLPMQDRTRQLAYEELWYTNWNVLRSVVDIAGSTSESQQVKSEYTNLSDIYHSLGAARTAVLSAWVAVFVIAMCHFGRFTSKPGESLAGLVLISGLTAGLYLVLHNARGRTWRSAAASLSLGLRWLHWRHGDDLAQPEKRDGRRSDSASVDPR